MVDAVQEKHGAEEVVWDLSDLYKGLDDPAIERDLAEVQAKADQYAEKYRGRVASLTAQQFAESMQEAEVISDKMGRLGSFASLNWATDTNNAAFGAMLQRIREIGSQIHQKTLFFDLEWAAVPDEKVKIVDDPALANWRHYLLDQLKYRPHLLSEPEEKILAEKAVTGVQAWSRYFGEVFGAARYKWKGQDVPQDVVLRQLYVPDRSEREQAAAALTDGLKTTLKTATYVFNTIAADKASSDRLRKYPTWISARNLDNEASDATVEALISAVTSRYDVVARYYTLKRKLLGVDRLYDYDRYAPVARAESRYNWDRAREIVLTAFDRFHPRIAEVAGEFFSKNWIHAPARPGKRGGAFASPTVSSHHPYIFLNFTGIGRDVMTLAHELGHGIHMYLSRPKGQFGAYTPLTTAEMASTFGEMLVFDDVLARETDVDVKISELAQKIEDSFATIFRQISLNRFEDLLHTARRKEGELSSERISELWMQSQRAMFGDSLTMRDEYATWWSYIPHFINTPGYVYAYSFGELLVMALYNQYKQEGASFAPKYIEVLSMGGSDKPENILKIAGIDLNDPNFWSQGLTALEQLVIELEGLVNGR